MNKIIAVILILAGGTLWGADSSAGRRLQPISRVDMARRTLEEEELEMSIAEERAAAKFELVYNSGADDLVKPRAGRIHDRVTFLINEKTDTKIEAKNDLSSSNNNILDVSNWFKLGSNSKGNRQLKPYSVKSDDGSFTDNDEPQIDFSSDMEHDGEGKTNRKATFTTKLSGEVIEVLPNGHLVVQARKSIHINEETQEVLLVGTVDPNDLNDASEIDGDKVIDLKVALKGKGDVADTIRQGWMSKMINKFKPF